MSDNGKLAAALRLLLADVPLQDVGDLMREAGFHAFVFNKMENTYDDLRRRIGHEVTDRALSVMLKYAFESAISAYASALDRRVRDLNTATRATAIEQTYFRRKGTKP